MALTRLLLLLFGIPATGSLRGYPFTGDYSVLIMLTFLVSLPTTKGLLPELSVSVSSINL